MKKILGLGLLSASLLASCGQQAANTVSVSVPSPAGVGAVTKPVDPAFQAQSWRSKTPTPPPPGQDIVVFNDSNIFINDIPSIPTNAQNQKLFRNLVNFITSGARNASKQVWLDRGHGSNDCKNFCADGQLSILASAFTANGYTPIFKHTVVGDLASIPASVKVLMLFMPQTAYSKAEINSMKMFASEGGRIIFVGEWDGFYGASGIAIENDFLSKMGAVMKNIGNAVDCDPNTIPATSLRTTQVTTDLTSLQMACSSVIVPGPQDFIFMYDTKNTLALAGVARIDITPLP